MKKVLLVLVTVLAFNLSNAQTVSPERLQNIVNLANGLPLISQDSTPYVSNEDIFIEATTMIKKKSEWLRVDSEKKRVVPVHGKTADEIFNMVEIAIAKHWKNPDEVVEGKSTGKYIKIRGGGSDVVVKILGTTISYSTVAAYMIQFKDGKFMYTISYETRFPPSQYSSGGLFSTVIQTKRKNGKEIEVGLNTAYRINLGVNSFINEILASDPESEINSDW